MESSFIFWPMIAHAALVFGIYGLLGTRRKAAVTAGSARVSQFRENREEPAESIFVRNNLTNQFELPILFHICCLALVVVDGVSGFAVVLAWLFVASRYLHTLVHVTSNRIRFRQPLFSAGYLVLIGMWLLLAFALV